MQAPSTSSASSSTSVAPPASAIAESSAPGVESSEQTTSELVCYILELLLSCTVVAIEKFPIHFGCCDVQIY